MEKVQAGINVQDVENQLDDSMCLVPIQNVWKMIIKITKTLHQKAGFGVRIWQQTN